MRTKGTSFKTSLLLCCMSFLLASPLVSSPLSAQDILGIGVPYLPKKLNPLKAEELVSEAILLGLVSHFGEGSEKTSFVSERRRETTNGQEWVFEYKPSISLNDTTTFEPQIIIDTIDYFKSTGEESFKSVLDNIKFANFSKDSSLNSLTIALKVPDNNFPKKISNIPLINTSLAYQFKEKIGSGTNMPTYGNFIIKDFRPEDHLTLIKNHLFGLDNNPQGFEVVQFKKYPNDGSRIRALRTGNIMVILIPTLDEIKDSEGDTTLEIIDSPLKEQAPNDMFGDQSDTLIDISKIIIRKSLQTDKSFKDTFRLEGIKRGE